MIFAHDRRGTYLVSFFRYANLVWPAMLVEDDLISSLCTYCVLKKKKKNQVTLVSWTSIRLLNPLWSLCLFFMPASCSFYYYSSFVKLKVGNAGTSSSYFIVQDCLSYTEVLLLLLFCFFVFPYEVENCPFKVSVKIMLEFWCT